MARKFRWGVIGTGFIAKQFAGDLKLLPNAQLCAVSSRSAEAAKKFADEFGAEKSFGSRDDMLADKDIDIIYIATPNHCHAPDSIAALSAGKAVLCEKPFALNSAELERIIAAHESKNLFLMEALWTAFLPSFKKFIELASDGSIGEPMLLNADFGFKSPFNPASRLYDPAQGGGSIYDIGIYPLFAAYSLFGEPKVLQSIKIPSPSGTDAAALIQTLHENSKAAMLASSFSVDLDTEANLYGTKGKLKLHKCFHIPTKLTLQNDKGISEFEFKEEGNGYQHEAAAAMDAMDSGLSECPGWDLSKSRALMRMIDSALKAPLALAIAFLISFSFAEEAIDSSFAERMGAGSRELAMGNAMLADSSASFAAYWNPGMLAFKRGLSFALHGEERGSGRSGGAFGVESSVGNKMGIGMAVLFRSDEEILFVDEDGDIVRRETPFYAFGYAGISYRLGKRDGIGAVLSQSPLSADLGWFRFWNAKWQSALQVRNLGFNSKRLKAFEAGLTHRNLLAGKPASASILLSSIPEADEPLKGRFGFEWRIVRNVDLRFGIDGENPSAGWGYDVNIYGKTLSIDYAFIYEKEAGSLNPLSLTLRMKL